jgi:hypothetical protein
MKLIEHDNEPQKAQGYTDSKRSVKNDKASGA